VRLEWGKPDPAAAGADRRQKATRLGGNQQEQRPWGRLLERFQQGIGSVHIELVRRVDNDYALNGFSWSRFAASSMGKESSKPPHLINRDNGRNSFFFMKPRPAN